MSLFATVAFVFLPFALLSLSALCLRLPTWLRWPVVLISSAEGLGVAFVAFHLG